MENLAVIGCGKLGLPLIACLANAGHKVLGIDNNQSLIKSLNQGQIPWEEVDLFALVQKNKSLINFQTEYNDAFSNVSTSFIIVPTPSNSEGEYSIDYVISAIESIGNKLNTIDFNSHTIVIVSTVMPGDTEGRIMMSLKNSSGNSFEKISLCYSPEFIALGSVVRNLQYPDTILIGQSSDKDGDRLEKLLVSMVLNQPKILRLRIIEAEIAKIAINSFVTTKISFSNQISEICEKLPGASSVKVLNAIGSDSRIGKSYLMQGTGYGGPCFPRDNRAFAKFAKNLGLNLEIAIAADQVNHRQRSRLLNTLTKLAPRAINILLIGVAYKTDTAVYEESPALKLIESDGGYNFYAYDDYVKEIKSNNQINVNFINSFEDNSVKFDVAILFVPSESYSRLPDHLDNSVLLIDFWGLWEDYREKRNSKYIRVGEFLK